MNKTDFLNEISNMDKSQIRELLNNKIKRVKKIAPAIIIKKQNEKGDKFNESKRINKPT